VEREIKGSDSFLFVRSLGRNLSRMNKETSMTAQFVPIDMPTAC
jgi:hypothetical protein